MNRERLVEILRDALCALAESGQGFPSPPTPLEEGATLISLGITRSSSEFLTEELKTRLGAVPDISLMLLLEELNQGRTLPCDAYNTVKHLVSHLHGSINHWIRNPQTVYVDDDGENLFVFRRRYGSRMNLVTFEDPREAREYILKTREVVLVITDEVMPHHTGNQLREIIHAQKPFLKFILITGNPMHDENLMYRSLKGNRFFDFLEKPLDFENKAEKYFELFNQVLTGDFY